MRLFQVVSREFFRDAPNRKRREMFCLQSRAALLRHLISAVRVVLLGSALASAQFDTGTITGLVTDASSAVIPHATVTIANVGTSLKKTLQTDSGGNFTATALPS